MWHTYIYVEPFYSLKFDNIIIIIFFFANIDLKFEINYELLCKKSPIIKCMKFSHLFTSTRKSRKRTSERKSGKIKSEWGGNEEKSIIKIAYFYSHKLWEKVSMSPPHFEPFLVEKGSKYSRKQTCSFRWWEKKIADDTT